MSSGSPRFFVPVHGELRHLVQHARLANDLGIPKENIAVVENGYPLTLNDSLHIGKRLPGENVYVDGSRVGDVGPAVLAQRDGLAQSGFVTAVARYDRKAGKAVGEPRIITHGFVAAPRSGDLLARAREVVRSAAKNGRGTAADSVEDKVEQALSSFFYRETRRKPVITVALVES